MPEFDHGGGGSGVIDPPTDDAQGLPNWEPDETSAVRCLICNIEWPLIPLLFSEGALTEKQRWIDEEELEAFMERALKNELPCPVCREPCSFATNFLPIGDEEAWSLRNNAEFERYYKRTRGREADAD